MPEDTSALFGSGAACQRPADSLLFGPDDPAEDLFLLEDGTVELYELTATGRRLVIARLRPGSVFGIMALLGRRSYGNFAETIEDSRILALKKADLADVVRAHPGSFLSLLQLVGKRIETLEHRLLQASYSPTRVRLAQHLLESMDPASGYVSNATRESIGESIGASRQTVSECVAALARAGVLEGGRGWLRIVDRRALQHLSGRGH